MRRIGLYEWKDIDHRRWMIGNWKRVVLDVFVFAAAICLTMVWLYNQ